MAPGVREVQTFMFTDIVDSTRLVELLGDDGWDSLLSWHDRTVRACLTARSGHEVKHEGDGFFIAFRIRQSAPIARSRCSAPWMSTGANMASHHGSGSASTLRRQHGAAEDFFGQGVHRAARVGAAGAAGQILSSADDVAEAGGGYAASEPISRSSSRDLPSRLTWSKWSWR